MSASRGLLHPLRRSLLTAREATLYRSLSSRPNEPRPEDDPNAGKDALDETRDTSRDKELFGTTARFDEYDEDDLTDVAETPEHLKFKHVQACLDRGFKVNNQRLMGPILVTRRLVFSWHPAARVPFDLTRPNQPLVDPAKLTYNDFEALHLFRPPIDLLIVGTGKSLKRNPTLDRELRRICPVEWLDTRNAAGTFNLLSRDGRVVAAFLLPRGTV